MASLRKGENLLLYLRPRYAEYMPHLSTVGYEKNKMDKIFELENMVSNLYARGENERLSRPSRTTIIESLCLPQPGITNTVQGW